MAVIFAFFPPRGLDNFSLLTDHTLPEQTKYYLTNYIRNITFSRDELTWDHSNHDLDLTDSAVREALKHMCEALKRITGDHTSDIDTVGNWKGKTYSSVYQSILDYIINCIQVFDRSYPGTHLNDL